MSRRSCRLSFLLLLVAPLALACGEAPTAPGSPGQFEPTAPCVNGQADGYACQRVDLLARVPIDQLELEATANFSAANDLWGWSDSQTGRDYVLVGRQDGVSIVDVTDPLEPVSLARLPSAAGVSIWRDVKVYRDHAYVVADAVPGHGVQVLDLRRLRGVSEFTVLTEDARYDEVSSVHNIAINEETGFAYAVGSNAGGTTCGGGLHMIDVRTPASPRFAGCFAQAGTGFAKAGYTHDVQCVVYDGPDTEHRGREICFASNETAIVIADVTDKGSPVALAMASYPDAGYVHQGWLTPDRRYFLQNDELDELNGVVTETRLLVWDVADLDDPVLATEHLGPTGASDHNLYVSGDLAWYSNYAYGVRVLDVRDPRNPKEFGFFDTHPGNDRPGFDGSWSNYPFFGNGVIAVSSSRDGLFLLQRGR